VSDGGRRVAAVVLAAGASTRLGRPKQLVEFRGATLVARAAVEARRAGADPVIVVLGANASEIALVLADAPGVTTIVNERWREGLATSLAAGVREAMRNDGGPACDGVLIVMSDQPLVDHVAFRALIDEFEDGARLVAASYAGTVGVPAIIGREHFGALLELAGDEGAGRWLRARLDELRVVPVPGAEVDIDTSEDAERLAALA
jgi:molybdenum cofactor cytidylyltransferase